MTKVRRRPLTLEVVRHYGGARPEGDTPAFPGMLQPGRCPCYGGFTLLREGMTKPRARRRGVVDGSESPASRAANLSRLGLQRYSVMCPPSRAALFLCHLTSWPAAFCHAPLAVRPACRPLDDGSDCGQDDADDDVCNYAAWYCLRGSGVCDGYDGEQDASDHGEADAWLPVDHKRLAMGVRARGMRVNSFAITAPCCITAP